MIDITTYRMRIGCFRPTRCRRKHDHRAKRADSGTRHYQTEAIGSIIQIALLLLVIQIRTHLIISGDVEQNPGPITSNDKDTTPAQDIANNIQGNQK